MRVLVTGGSGFLGTSVCERLRQLGVRRLVAPRSSQYDLRRFDDPPVDLDEVADAVSDLAP